MEPWVCKKWGGRKCMGHAWRSQEKAMKGAFLLSPERFLGISQRKGTHSRLIREIPREFHRKRIGWTTCFNKKSLDLFWKWRQPAQDPFQKKSHGGPTDLPLSSAQGCGNRVPRSCSAALPGASLVSGRWQHNPWLRSGPGWMRHRTKGGSSLSPKTPRCSQSMAMTKKSENLTAFFSMEFLKGLCFKDPYLGIQFRQKQVHGIWPPLKALEGVISAVQIFLNTYSNGPVSNRESGHVATPAVGKAFPSCIHGPCPLRSLRSISERRRLVWKRSCWSGGESEEWNQFHWLPYTWVQYINTYNLFAANPTFARIGSRISFDMLKSLRGASVFLLSKT